MATVKTVRRIDDPWLDKLAKRLGLTEQDRRELEALEAETRPRRVERVLAALGRVRKEREMAGQ